MQENGSLFRFDCKTLEKIEEQGSTTQAQSKKVTAFSMFHFEVIYIHQQVGLPGQVEARLRLCLFHLKSHSQPGSPTSKLSQLEL